MHVLDSSMTFSERKLSLFEVVKRNNNFYQVLDSGNCGIQG